MRWILYSVATARCGCEVKDLGDHSSWDITGRWTDLNHVGAVLPPTRPSTWPKERSAMLTAYLHASSPMPQRALTRIGD